MCVLAFLSCKERRNPEPKKISNESLIRANRIIAGNEKADIDSFVQRKGWKLLQTGTGLRYAIIHSNPGGKPVLKGETFRYRSWISFPDGMVVYPEKDEKVKEAHLENGEFTAGVEEALKILKYGESARLLIPSHLAFGLSGDQDQIPPRSVLIYDIEILENQK